jgi:hypothetical protein
MARGTNQARTLHCVTEISRCPPQKRVMRIAPYLSDACHVRDGRPCVFATSISESRNTGSVC